MRKIILAFICLFSINSFAQDEVTLKISGEEYKQLEKHFNNKQTDKRRKSDWAQFNRYAKANEEIKGQKIKAVFMGNSITDNWARRRPEFFKNNGYVGRGISGQTSSEMLVRFQADVINLHPKVVVILAGTNDIAGNNGIIELEHTMENIISMCELAKLHKITPILCSVTPSIGYRWRKDLKPAESITKLNKMIKAYADKMRYTYVDYFSALADERGAMGPGLSDDDCHPTNAGYEIMEPIIKKAVSKHVK